MAMLNAREIAAVGADPENRLVCLVMGTNDLLKESRARALHNRFAVVPWLAMTIVAARAYGLDISTASTTTSRTRRASARNASTGARSAWTARR